MKKVPNRSKIIIHDAGSSRWISFSDPLGIITADTPANIPSALKAVEEAIANGNYAAGFICYEAAPAFDPALVAHDSGSLPLLWFGVYKSAAEIPAPAPPNEEQFSVSPWKPSISEQEYQDAIQRIKDYIASGDTYQVNFTMRLRADFSGDPRAFFDALCLSQRADYSAYLDIGDHVLCSASPELFFKREGSLITCKPMKGTAGRGLTSSEDKAHAEWLHSSEKNRAENLMIVDMIRNDLGRIAETGSVKTVSLFDVERYDTLWQMTSTVTAESCVSISELFGALFPCASITGAPKVRTCQIIKELEHTPRGIYTGCIGFIAPNGDAQFNVAIRTVHLDKRSGKLEYGIGGGITWDSDAEEEYRECETKALVLTARRPPFQLLETMLWKPESGYFLLEQHLRRLADSANYFGIPLDIAAVEKRLHQLEQEFNAQNQRVRLLVDEAGTIHTEAAPLAPTPLPRWRVAIAREPIDMGDYFIYHKTTHRAVYEKARAAAPGFDDVLLWNARGEVTESTIANVVIRKNGRLLTPPVSCGLLPGAYREYLLNTGEIEEAVITLDNLKNAKEVFLINSVRGWVPVEVQP